MTCSFESSCCRCASASTKCFWQRSWSSQSGNESARRRTCLETNTPCHKEKEAGTACEGGTHSGFQLFGDGVFMVSVKDIEDVQKCSSNCSVAVLAPVNVNEKGQRCLQWCRTGTVVWRVGSGFCPSLGTARRNVRRWLDEESCRWWPRLPVQRKRQHCVPVE